MRRSGNLVRKLIGAGLISAALLVTACNTIHGAGKDVSSAGNAVANAADNAK